MKSILRGLNHAFEFVAATMMAAMFAIFILQITIRYSARAEWIADIIPLLEPTLYGWTLDFCLLMWIWIVFWGNGLIVRHRDHVIFDIIYTNVTPHVRKWFAIFSAITIAICLLLIIEPTWSKFYILRLKKTATLSNVFGDWIRVRDIYLVFFIFSFAVAFRYFWRAYYILKNGAEDDLFLTTEDNLRLSDRTKNDL